MGVFAALACGMMKKAAAQVTVLPEDPTVEPWPADHRHVIYQGLKLEGLAVADIDGDGVLDIVFSEAETTPAQLVWLEGPDFKRSHVLRIDLFHVHSLAIADFNSDGSPDIFAGEMNLGRHLEHADGTPFFWLGDTWWMGLCRRLLWPDEFQMLVADRAAKGFTVIQIVAGLSPDMAPFDDRSATTL